MRARLECMKFLAARIPTLILVCGCQSAVYYFITRGCRFPQVEGKREKFLISQHVH